MQGGDEQEFDAELPPGPFLAVGFRSVAGWDCRGWG